MPTYAWAPPTLRHKLRFGIIANGTTLALALDSCGITANRSQVANTDGMRGQMAATSAVVAEGTCPVGGPFAWRPRPEELRVVLPLVFGGFFSGNTLNPDSLSSFIFAFDRNPVAATSYAGMKINTATFSSAAGGCLTLACQAEGLTATDYPSSSYPNNLELSRQQPFVHHSSSLMIGGVTSRPCNNVTVGVANNLVLDRFNNSSTRTDIPEGGRTVSFACDQPFSASEYADLMGVSAVGIAAAVSWTSSSHTLTFTFPCLQAAPKAPATPGTRTEMPLRMEFTARRKGGSTIPQEVQVTLT